MDKYCRICGKKIIGDVITHFEEKHFSMFVANRTQLQQHPGAFVTNKEEKTPTPYVRKEKEHYPFDKRIQGKIMGAMTKKLGEQTYRGFDEFKCDGCHGYYKYGKVIYCNSNNIHLCYECYKHIKEIFKEKRGNKHVFINTPM